MIQYFSANFKLKLSSLTLEKRRGLNCGLKEGSRTEDAITQGKERFKNPSINRNEIHDFFAILLHLLGHC
jgi:hypothetical protein